MESLPQIEGADDLRKSRFTGAQVIEMIEEQKAGMAAPEGCRTHGPSPAMVWKLKATFGGMELSDARRLEALADGNAPLERLPADTMLDDVVFKDLPGKH